MKSNKYLLPQVRWDSGNRFPFHLHIDRKMKKLIENPRRSWREKTANFNEFDDFQGSLKVNYIIIQFGYISELIVPANLLVASRERGFLRFPVMERRRAVKGVAMWDIWPMSDVYAVLCSIHFFLVLQSVLVLFWLKVAVNKLILNESLKRNICSPPRG